MHANFLRVLIPLTFFVLQEKKLKAQDAKLYVGDTFPEISFALAGPPNQAVSISDLPGDLIILDLWSKSCAPCIRKMPAMDSLQTKYEGKITILPITRHATINDSVLKDVQSFWKKNPFLKRTSLTTAVDTSLGKYFHIPGVPYIIWLNKNRKIIGITSSEYVNEDNIESILKGGRPKWANKLDTYFDPQNTVSSYGERYNTQKTSNSLYLTGFIDRMLPTFGFEDKDSTRRFFAINFTLYNLYFVLIRGYNGNSSLEPKLVVKESAKELLSNHEFEMVKKFGESWYNGNSYCMETTSTLDSSMTSFCSRLLNFLNMQFNLNGQLIEKDAYYLHSIKQKSTTLSPSNDYTEKDCYTLKSNQSLIDLLNSQQELSTMEFLLSPETGSGSTIRIPKSVFHKGDIKKLNAFLQKYYGINFVKGPDKLIEYHIEHQNAKSKIYYSANGLLNQK